MTISGCLIKSLKSIPDVCFSFRRNATSTWPRISASASFGEVRLKIIISMSGASSRRMRSLSSSWREAEKDVEIISTGGLQAQQRLGKNLDKIVQGGRWFGALSPHKK